MANNRFLGLGNPATVLNGTSYLPSTGYLTNASHQEIEFVARRHAVTGSGALDITLQQFVPQGNYFVDLVGGNNVAIKFLQWAAAAVDAADTPKRLRVGVGAVANADLDGFLLVGSHHWFDYTPPQFWRLKLVEAGTTSTLYLTANLTRG